MVTILGERFAADCGMYKSGLQEPTTFYRDHVVAWSKDLGRTIDYLETRKDLRADTLAYFWPELGLDPSAHYDFHGVAHQGSGIGGGRF